MPGRVVMPGTCSPEGYWSRQARLLLAVLLLFLLGRLFSFMVLAGFFLSLFFESKPLLMSLSAVWLGGMQRVTRSEV